MKKLLLLFIVSLLSVACKKEKQTDLTGNQKQITVQNENGEKESNASVKIFASVSDLIADTNAVSMFQSNENGIAVLPENTTNTIICLVQKGEKTSEFISTQYTGVNNNYTITISLPSSNQLLCGHGSKKWLMTGYSINGVPQSYVVTSTINSDGTWTDTNGNSGTWHFENNNTELVYDYSGSGMTVVFTVLEFTKNDIRLRSVQSGMTIDMEMTAVY